MISCLLISFIFVGNSIQYRVFISYYICAIYLLDIAFLFHYTFLLYHVTNFRALVLNARKFSLYSENIS